MRKVAILTSIIFPISIAETPDKHFAVMLFPIRHIEHWIKTKTHRITGGW